MKRSGSKTHVEPVEERGSVRQVLLRLKGFCGIQTGMGREEVVVDFESLGDARLVAIAGPNGAGKTTLLDNMHPYRVMPSRAGGEAAGGFSFYEHLASPEALKELIWEHEGRRYRTQLLFRMNGRRKTEAYLHEWVGTSWQPVTLADGTIADGKTDTYDRCVERILGSAQTYFTSVFSAQGRRPLSDYRNAEIKALLADLLELDDVKEHGQRAADVAKHLKTALGERREALSRVDRQLAAEAAVAGRRAALEVSEGEAAKAQAQAAAALDKAQSEQARTAAEAALEADTLARRTRLMTERAAAEASLRDERRRLDAERMALQERSQRLQAAVNERDRANRRGLEALQARLAEAHTVLGKSKAVARARAHAARRVSVVAERSERVTTARERLARQQSIRATVSALEQQIEALRLEAGRLKLDESRLRSRFGLVEKVPCAGTDLAGRCSLLGDAREAQTMLPDAAAGMARVESQYVVARQALAESRSELQALAGAREQLLKAEAMERASHARLRADELTAAREGEISAAQRSAEALGRELQEIGRTPAGPTDGERGEIAHIESATSQLLERAARAQAELDDRLAKIDQALGALPATGASARLPALNQALEAAKARLAAANSDLQSSRSGLQSAIEAARRAQELGAESRALSGQVQAIEAEVSAWTLLAKAMSNDGVIALAIDDAGPTLAALANDLLLATYGGRFTVAIRTQVETAKGEAREGFEIEVFDAQTGQSKGVGVMSGGERVWINECLTRAVALYLAQNSGRRYQTLMSDEADGPLDLERKRMFMQLKREVLRIGGYEREYFVSQTQELTAMADAVIDMAAMSERQYDVVMTK